MEEFYSIPFFRGVLIRRALLYIHPYYCHTVQAFQEEMATHQPNMDALNKIAKKRKAETPTTNPEMTKKITSLYKRCPLHL